MNIDYNSFCNQYYSEAEKVADITITEHIKNHGKLNAAIDVQLVKDLGISYALEKAFATYDPDNEKGASVKTYLSRLVHNFVLNELGKEGTATGAKKRRGTATDDDVDVQKVIQSFMRTDNKAETKESLIAEMMKCMKKLSGIDQKIMSCWMSYARNEYAVRAIEELGWEDNEQTRNLVAGRRYHATEQLREMMKKSREVYVGISSDANKVPKEVEHVVSNVDYNAIRRRRRAITKSFAGDIDYKSLANNLLSML